MSRTMELDSFHQLLECARARLFPPSKWAGLFPSAAYRRSAPPQLALNRLNQCELGYYIITWRTSQRRKTRFDFSFAHDTIHTQITPLGMFRRGLNFFCNTKCQREFLSTLAFLASHEACRRMAVFSIQLTRNPYQTGEPRGLSPSGGNSAANLLSLVCPAPIGRGMGSRGTAPCASRRACRLTAVFSIQLTRNPRQTGEPWHPSCHGGKTPVKPHVTLRPCAHSAQRWVQGFSPANGCFGRSAGGSCGCRSAFR